MVYFLRDEKNVNYFECECYILNNEIKLVSHIYIRNLMNYIYKIKNSDNFNSEYGMLFHTFSFLEIFRGWFFETHYGKIKKREKDIYKQLDYHINPLIKIKLQGICEIYKECLQLILVID